jgi:hypothetical protein
MICSRRPQVPDSPRRSPLPQQPGADVHRDGHISRSDRRPPHTEGVRKQTIVVPVVNTGRQSCRCGHTRDAHEHYRSGTECSLCPSGECHSYVRMNGLRDRFSKLLRPKSRGNRSS